MKNPFRRRWALRDYDRWQGDIISESRHWFRFGAESIAAVHRGIFGRSGRFALKVERLP